MREREWGERGQRMERGKEDIYIYIGEEIREG